MELIAKNELRATADCRARGERTTFVVHASWFRDATSYMNCYPMSSSDRARPTTTPPRICGEGTSPESPSLNSERPPVKKHSHHGLNHLRPRIPRHHRPRRMDGCRHRPRPCSIPDSTHQQLRLHRRLATTMVLRDLTKTARSLGYLRPRRRNHPIRFSSSPRPPLFKNAAMVRLGNPRPARLHTPPEANPRRRCRRIQPHG